MKRCSSLRSLGRMVNGARFEEGEDLWAILNLRFLSLAPWLFSFGPAKQGRTFSDGTSPWAGQTYVVSGCRYHINVFGLKISHLFPLKIATYAGKNEKNKLIITYINKISISDP